MNERESERESEKARERAGEKERARESRERERVFITKSFCVSMVCAVYPIVSNSSSRLRKICT